MINYVKENIQVLAIAGDGQLARFIALSAHKYCLKVKFLTLNAAISPCRGLGELIETSDWKNSKKFEILLEDADILVLENEFLPAEFLAIAQDKNVYCYPNKESYSRLDNKFKQITLAQENNFLVPNSKLIQDICEIDFSKKFMLKAIRDGYDGYGNLLLDSNTPKEKIEKFINQYKNVLIQEFIDFDFEFSLLAARDLNGNCLFFPTAKTIQENNICHYVVSPAPIDPSLNQDTQRKITELLKNINAVGIFAFEFFFAQGKIYFNEIAPRPHNSYHYTLDNCNNSQFDILLKIILKQKLQQPKNLKPNCMMLNLLGTQEGYPDFKINHQLPCNTENLNIYLYQKKYSKPGRKMGHITLSGDDPQYIANQLKFIKDHYSL